MKKSQIYGTRAIIEAINADEDIDKIFIQKDQSNPLTKQLEGVANAKGIQISYVPVQKLNRLTKENHQGAVAQISPVTLQDFDTVVNSVLEKDKPALFLILDQLSDVRNFGAIVRTAECTGVDAIIIPKTGSAPITDDAIKTSAGAIFNMPICKVDHVKDAIFYLQGSGVQIVAATEKTEDNLYDTDFKLPTALVMGSEDKGVSPGVLKMVDKKAKLPMYGNISSLNVSVACGAFLYEVVRQRF